ncbi:MAG: hypothetical protein QXY20_09215 [Thermofilum sp.]
MLFAVDPKNIYGDYIPCRIGKGLLLRLRDMHAEWFLAERGEEGEEGARPPYLEYHFRAASLGAYDETTLSGNLSQWGYIEKYWNTLKYIDNRPENLQAPFFVGIKTWFFAAADGTKIPLSDNESRNFMTYDVVKVRFDFPISHIYGFVLVDDARFESAMEKLFDGWFVDKSRLKTLVAVKLDDVLVPTAEWSRELFVIPFIRRPRKPAGAMVSSLISREALIGRKRDGSVEKKVLHIEKPEDVDPDDKLLFKGRDGFLYAVDKSWLEYMELAGRGG